VFLGEGNLLHRDESETAGALEYLTPRAVFDDFCKLESISNGKEGYPTRDGHRKIVSPIDKDVGT